MKIKTNEEADVNITSLIDCLMNVIIFFMVIMSAQYVFGVAIKFPPKGSASQKSEQKQEKKIVVYVQSDLLDRAPDGRQAVRKDGVLKLNGEDIPMTRSGVEAWENWEKERKEAYELLRSKMAKLISEGYDTTVLTIQGDMKTYHGKIMQVIDKGKECRIEGFSLVPPDK